MKELQVALKDKQLLEIAMRSGNSVVPERLEFIPELKATIHCPFLEDLCLGLLFAPLLLWELSC